MATLIQIQKRVRVLEQILAPKPSIEIVFVMSFGPLDEPHGRYGYRRAHWNSRDCFTKYESLSEQEELEIMRQNYETVPDHCKEPGGVFETFEQYLSYHECKCPIHARKEE